MVKGHAKISSSSKVTGCAENSSFSNSDIQTENGRSQCFTPQKCPMKIQCRVHSVYSWTFHWEHVTAITYYAYKFQIFSNIPKYFQLLGCLDLLFELQRTLQGHSSSATASYHQAAKASLSLGVDKPPQQQNHAPNLQNCNLQNCKKNFYNRKGGGQKNAGHAEFWNTILD